MSRLFDGLVGQVKQVFWNQPIHVDTLFEESGPMSIYLAVWTVVETMSDDEIFAAAHEAAKSAKPFAEKPARFDESNWARLMSDALIACLQAELNKDSAIQAEEQKRMKDR